MEDIVTSDEGISDDTVRSDSDEEYLPPDELEALRRRKESRARRKAAYRASQVAADSTGSAPQRAPSRPVTQETGRETTREHATVYVNPPMPWLSHTVMTLGLRRAGMWDDMDAQMKKHHLLHMPTSAKKGVRHRISVQQRQASVTFRGSAARP